mmetsp:Transcript_15425/g.19743  ORF Transcript_15425/g.19743 Transcript_15425/m.19743 type:complete len:379 (+) Transcript_15425:173-1309(+)
MLKNEHTESLGGTAMMDTEASSPPPPPLGDAETPGPPASDSSAAGTAQPSDRTHPVVCIVLGMAGSGKTTMVQRLNHFMNEKDPGSSYYINLDPAVRQVPFAANIDIRDTVNYKEVMKQYKLGPNGAIMTSLNLFATRFDQVMHILEQRSQNLKYVFIDTPGQIEVFTWSASGTILTETLAFSFPTILLYVVDTPRTTNPTTFMSNMLYACSIYYKSKLPLLVTFNKTDISPATFATEWMSDFEKFQEALDAVQQESYMVSLNRSLSLVLDEFYCSLRTAAVSALTGDGMEHFFQEVNKSAEEFLTDYRPDLIRRIQEKKEKEEQRRKTELERLMKDIKLTKGDEAVQTEISLESQLPHTKDDANSTSNMDQDLLTDV